MDISAGTVSAGPNLTGRMDPGINTSILKEYIKGKNVCVSKYYNFLNWIFIFSYSVKISSNSKLYSIGNIFQYKSIISWSLNKVNQPLFALSLKIEIGYM